MQYLLYLSPYFMLFKLTLACIQFCALIHTTPTNIRAHTDFLFFWRIFPEQLKL